MQRMAERDLFSVDYDVPADRLWEALKRSLQTMDVREVLEGERSARFDSGVTAFSWGEHHLAHVEGHDGHSRLVVRGRPKSSFFTTGFGERRHGRSVEKQLTSAIESELTAGAIS